VLTTDKERSMKKVKLGLIGLGLMGKPHAKILKKVEECDLVAASDVDEKQKAITEELGIKFYKNYEEMIEKETLEGVIITTPNHLHAPMGIACAQKGLHLFVEKPIAQNVSEADRLIEAAKKHKVQILVGHQRRFSSLVEKAREIVTGGELGRLVGVQITWALLKPPAYFEGPMSWRKEKGAGPVLINLIHEIDNLRYICGEVEELYAVTSRKIRNFPVEDTAAITMRFKNGAVGTVFLSDCTPSLTSWEATSAENAYIYYDFGNCYNFFGTEGSLLFPQMKRLYYSDPSKIGWNFPITEQGYKMVREDPYIKEFSHFCRVIQGKEDPRTSGEDGKRTLEVTLAIQRSGETGQPIRL
jgi:predicted dehydrogenase